MKKTFKQLVLDELENQASLEGGKSSLGGYWDGWIDCALIMKEHIIRFPLDDYQFKICIIAAPILEKMDFVALHLGELVDGIKNEDQERVAKKYEDIKGWILALQHRIDELEDKYVKARWRGGSYIDGLWKDEDIGEMIIPYEPPNPLFMTTQGWYYCDEVWSTCKGPFKNEQAARADLNEYVKGL